MNKYKVTITRQYTQSYEICAYTEDNALEEADEKFCELDLKGEDLEYISEDKAELIELDEDMENPNAYDEWDEWNRFYRNEEE